MFSQFAPLVVGDDSKNYQTTRKLQTIIQRNLWDIAVNLKFIGKERSECGAIKGMTVNGCKGSKETFGNL